MCGRTSLANLPEHLRPFLQRHGVPDAPPWYTPRYNIAPSQDQMVVTEHDGMREVRPMRWGLVPSWAKDSSVGNRMVNARSETLTAKPSYRDAFARRRGVIVADSYYEWRANKVGAKTPFRVHREDNEPIMLAALWEQWGPTDSRLETCTVVTTAATGIMTQIHGRMPVIVPDDALGDWLATRAPAALLQRIIDKEANGMACYAVSIYVNAPGNDDSVCWEPAGDA